MADPALLEVLAHHSLFRALVDQSPLMLLVLDDEGGCIYSSRARLVFRGRTLEQERGTGWTDTIHPSDRKTVVAEIMDAVAARRPFAVKHRAFRADGACRWISSQGLPWFTPEHVYVGHVTITADITDHGHLDVISREEPRALRRLIENAHDMVYRTRFFPTHAIEYLGGAVFAITGHTAAEFYADSALPEKCVHPDDRHLC